MSKLHRRRNVIRLAGCIEQSGIHGQGSRSSAWIAWPVTRARRLGQPQMARGRTKMFGQTPG
jgi:hypothetical protein